MRLTGTVKSPTSTGPSARGCRAAASPSRAPRSEQERDLAEPCRAAARAASAASGTLARADPSLLFSIALHAGDIAYGNIGGRTRLDFTVIGPTVNHASRLLELTKRLGEPILVSEAFRAASGLELRSLGSQALRDVPRPRLIHAL